MRGHSSTKLIYQVKIEKITREILKETQLNKQKEIEDVDLRETNTKEEEVESEKNIWENRSKKNSWGDYGTRDLNRKRLAITNQPLTVTKLNSIHHFSFYQRRNHLQGE